MERKIEFNNIPTYKSSLTIVHILKQHLYYFVPVTEYDNNLFYCTLKCERTLSKFENFIKKTSYKLWKFMYSCYQDEHILKITTELCDGTPISIPMVFNQKDVNNIIEDCPETYIGEKTL